MRVFVSVTTTKARLGIFFYSLQSLKNQNYDNFRITVNLSKDPYLLDDGIDEVPDWMSGENVQVNFVNNTGPYRKLIPLIEQVDDDDLVVTVDDDVLYSENWLTRMVCVANEHSNSVICGGARRIRKNVLGRYMNYSKWSLCPGQDTAMDLLPIGVYGVAYRRRLLDLDFLTDASHVTHAPTADDVWFRLASIRKNTTVHVDPEIARGNAYIEHDMGLQEINIGRSDNRRGLIRRAANQLMVEIRGYLGDSLSPNDSAWKSALAFSKSKVVNK